MAKKFVRGITGIKEINKQDFDTNNVNDLLSDGEHNYIHRKKHDGSEEYHCLTNNLKSVTSSDTNLLEVAIDEATSTANLTPKHDTQKEQSIESASNTIIIEHGENGTSETTKVDTNPQKVLEHNNLLVDYGLYKQTINNVTSLGFEYTKVTDGYDLNNLTNGNVRAGFFTNAPQDNTWYYVTSFSGATFSYQKATTVLGNTVKIYERVQINSVWQQWREQVSDKTVIDNAIAQKQNTLTNNASIGVVGTGLRQLYALKQTYTSIGGVLKTHVKSLSVNTNTNIDEEEFNFIVKLDKNVSSVNFTLNSHDTTKFENIMTAYGENNTVRISGCVFTLSGSTLTVSTTNNTAQNYVITFSDII